MACNKLNRSIRAETRILESLELGNVNALLMKLLINNLSINQHGKGR